MPRSRPIQPQRTAIAPKFDNGQDWHHDPGDVPLSRIIFDPWLGTATEEDLLLLVERDKRLCELVDGTLVEKSTGLDKSFVAAAVGAILRQFVKTRKLGSVSAPDATLRLMPSNRIRLPDVGYFSNARLAACPPPRPKVPKISPDLAVEVLSEGNRPAEMLEKRKEYFAAGTRLFWFIDLKKRSVAIYSSPEKIDRVLSVDDVIDAPDVLPGFTSPVANFFDDLEPA